MKVNSSMLNASVGMNGLLAYKAADLAIPNGASKWIDVTAEPADTQKTDTSSEKISKLSESVPGCSRQTENENRQDVLQRWLEETYSRLFFLSKNERSVSFISFVSSLKNKQVQRETIEKSTLESLLALDEFFSNSAPLLLPTHFFIKNLLKKYRLLIDGYRESFANLAEFKDSTDQSKKIEVTGSLRQEIENLEKEKAALLNKQEELNVEYEILLQLTELTNDLDKFGSERSRSFSDEIALNKKHLEACKNELTETSKEIKRELSFAEQQQLEANIKIKSRNIRNLVFELEQIQEMLGNVDKFGSSNIIKQKKELEQNEEKLISEINNLDLKTIFMKQLESSCNSPGNLFSEKSKIETDLQKGRLALDKINILMQTLANLTPTEDSSRVSFFVGKINSNLRLESYKKKREDEQEKINAQYRILAKKLVEIEKELGEAESPRSKKGISLESNLKEYSETLLAQEKAKLEDAISKLKGQIELNKELLDLVREEYDANQGELITLLDDEGQALIVLIKQLLEKTRKESSERLAELTKEKEALELFDKKEKLDEQKRELEEQLCKIEKDERVWNMLADGKLIQILECLEKLQGILEESEKKVDKFEKKLAELKAKFVKSPKNSGKDINKCEAELKRHKEVYQVQESAEEDYREQIKRIINEKRDRNQFELQQNEKSLRFNSSDIRRLTAKIEWREAKESVKEAEDLLLRTVVASLEDNNTTAPPGNFFLNSFTAVLRELKEQVDRAEWNTHGWGFFCKKVPDGIQKIRSLLNKIFNDLSFDGRGLQHYEQNLFMLSRFSDIYHLIKQKNSSKKCLRSSGVKRFYQSVGQSLEPLYEKLNAAIDPDWFRVLLVNPTTTSNQAFDFLSNNLFKEQVPESSEDGMQLFPTLSSGSSC